MKEMEEARRKLTIENWETKQVTLSFESYFLLPSLLVKKRQMSFLSILDLTFHEM